MKRKYAQPWTTKKKNIKKYENPACLPAKMLAQGLPLRQGAQLAVDATLTSQVGRDGYARHASFHDLVAETRYTDPPPPADPPNTAGVAVSRAETCADQKMKFYNHRKIMRLPRKMHVLKFTGGRKLKWTCSEWT